MVWLSMVAFPKAGRKGDPNLLGDSTGGEIWQVEALELREPPLVWKHPHAELDKEV